MWFLGSSLCFEIILHLLSDQPALFFPKNVFDFFFLQRSGADISLFSLMPAIGMTRLFPFWKGLFGDFNSSIGSFITGGITCFKLQGCDLLAGNWGCGIRGLFGESEFLSLQLTLELHKQYGYISLPSRRWCVCTNTPTHTYSYPPVICTCC